MSTSSSKPIFQFYTVAHADQNEPKFFVKDNKVCHKFKDTFYQIYWPDASPPRQVNPGLFFLGGGCDETPLMERCWNISKGDVVVDVGAHIGTWTLPALKLGASHVYCFEPYLPACVVLRNNLILNGWGDVEACIIRKILWNSEDGMSHFTIGGYDNPIQAWKVPLDNYLFEKLDWIKIDVEGNEFRVLEGARKTITRHRPKIVIELHKQDWTLLIHESIPPDYGIKKLDQSDNGAGHYLLYPIE